MDPLLIHQCLARPHAPTQSIARSPRAVHQTCFYGGKLLQPKAQSISSFSTADEAGPMCPFQREHLRSYCHKQTDFSDDGIYGYLTDKDKQQINSMFRKAERWQLILNHYDFYFWSKTAESQLFKKSMNSTHCLNHLYTQKETAPNAMTLRKRGRGRSPKHAIYFNRAIFGQVAV